MLARAFAVMAWIKPPISLSSLPEIFCFVYVMAWWLALGNELSADYPAKMASSKLEVRSAAKMCRDQVSDGDATDIGSFRPGSPT